ncbi:trypsin-1-like [Trichogramma pretiosum]|uniref:trypsin-1-like n=1 Tax=Trichogramma pretiosum TaxID=7493 RepID=UPI0006C9C6AB|nr:trypsin-1-like [Trichogramma pretiosum]
MFELIILFLVATATDGHPSSVSRNETLIRTTGHHGRIVGGEEASIENHPWLVSLQALGFHVCGGSIISETLVLTAAHCTKYSVKWLSVRTASSTKQAGGVVHRVDEILRHELYATNSFGIPVNDLAILRLRTSIDFDAGSRPISLFDYAEDVAEGSLLTITGWGSLGEGGPATETLRSVQVPVVSKARCGETYEMWGGLPEGQICAAYAEGGKDTCQGDSGGPLVLDGRQAGIVSWGNGCAKKGYPGVYTEIAYFRNWISEKTGI